MDVVDNWSTLLFLKDSGFQTLLKLDPVELKLFLLQLGKIPSALAVSKCVCQHCQVERKMATVADTGVAPSLVKLVCISDHLSTLGDDFGLDVLM